MMNQAHFSLWCIISAPLITGMSLTNMSQDILDIIVNVDAVAVNQNYLNNAGDVITEFDGISNSFKQQYEQEMERNDNQTELLFKPLPLSVGNGAFVFLNRDNSTSYSVSLDFNQLPITSDHNSELICIAKDIWSREINKSSSFSAKLPPQSVRFILLSDCLM